MEKRWIRLALAFALVSPASSIRPHALGAEPSGSPSLSLHPSKPLPSGGFELTIQGAPDGMVALQSSTDLHDWATETSLAIEGGSVHFTELQGSLSTRKFYRAIRMIRVTGTVREVVTDAPVPHATVALTLVDASQPLASTIADEIGGFELYAVPPHPELWFNLTFSAPGYAPYTFQASSHLHQMDFSGVAPYLSPLDYRPPNDDFENREEIESLDTTVTGYTANASRQMNDPIFGVESDFWIAPGNTLWWTWTAPADGAVKISATHSIEAGPIAVYQGESLIDLTRVWESIQGNDGFFVKAGQSYEIVFASHHAGKVELALESITPISPAIVDFPHASGPWFEPTFAVKAQGTQPLHYQWRKNGEPLPGATNPFLDIHPLSPGDEGAYSVEISNEAGSVVSREAIITAEDANSLLTGSWQMQVTYGPYLGEYVITFSGTTFTLARAADGAPAGEGTYTLTLIGGEYQLVMRYTGEFEGDVDEYTLTILNLDHIQFSGTVSSGGSRRATARGTFTRL